MTKRGLFSVPTSNAKSLAGGGASTPFGAGSWKGILEEVRVKDELPRTQAGQLFAGFAGPTGRILTLIIGSNEPLEGQDGVGARKRFEDFVVEDGGMHISDVDVAARDVPHWKLQRSALALANLAHALGAVEEEDGRWIVSETFLADLEDGAFKGAEIAYTIWHRKDKKDATKVYDEVETYFGA